MKRVLTCLTAIITAGLLVRGVMALDAADQSGRGRFSLTQQFNHLGSTPSPPPTVGTCAGFSLVSGGDLGGKVSMNSGTTCSLNFGTAFAAAPACTVTPGSAASTTLATTTTTQLSVTFGTANTAFSFICIGL